MIDFESKEHLPPGALVGLAEVSQLVGWSLDFIKTNRKTFPAPIGRVALRNARGNKHWANVFDRAAIEAWAQRMRFEVEMRKRAKSVYRKAVSPEVVVVST
jgi:hypothetical protein